MLIKFPKVIKEVLARLKQALMELKEAILNLKENLVKMAKFALDCITNSLSKPDECYK